MSISLDEKNVEVFTEGTTTISYENNFSIALSKNYVFHERRKQIYTKYHFIRDLINKGEIVL